MRAGVNPSYFDDCGDECPVEFVSWKDVQVFIDALNRIGEGTYMLPTEAQWEYAARAGSTTAFTNGSIPNANDECGYDESVMPVDSPRACFGEERQKVVKIKGIFCRYRKNSGPDFRASIRYALYGTRFKTRS